MHRLAGVALVVGAVVLPSLSARAQGASPAEIHDDYFLPVPITVNEGDSVTWTHEGTHPHSVTADGEFDSTEPGTTCTAIIGGDGCLSDGDQFTVTFTGSGTFNYHCRVHGAAMVGSVVVRSTIATTTSTTVATTTTTTETSTSLPGEQTTITQASLPSPPTTSRVALPKSIIRAKNEDDSRPWVFAAIGMAGGTAIAGIVLVRSGRVSLG